jgi:hypothetical protein
MKKEPLFDLINSLTMSEKRFFKIFSQRHVIGEENQYLELFHFIDNANELDNSILLKQAFVKNISAEKNYLYRLILKSLNVYYYEYSYKMKIQNYISNAEILTYKGLDIQALKLIHKAEKLAIDSELFAQLITLKQIEFEIHSKLNDYENALLAIDSIEKYQYKNDNFSRLQKDVTSLYKKRQEQGGIRTDKDIAELEQLILNMNNLPNNANKHLLLEGSLTVVYANSKKNYKKGLREIQKIIDLYENKYFLMEYSIKGYLSSIYNLANTYRNLNEFNKSIIALDKLDQMREHKLVLGSKYLSAYIFFISNNLRLLIYILEKEFDLAYKRHEQIKNDYADWETNIGKQFYFEHLVLITRILLEKKQYKQAIHYSNIVINDTSFKQRGDILSYIRLLNLITHFELNNDFSIEYFSISTKNYLKKKKRLFKTEELIIKFLIKHSSQNQKALHKICYQLKAMKTDPMEMVMFNLFDFYEWAKNQTKPLTLE